MSLAHITQKVPTKFSPKFKNSIFLPRIFTTILARPYNGQKHVSHQKSLQKQSITSILKSMMDGPYPHPTPLLHLSLNPHQSPNHPPAPSPVPTINPNHVPFSTSGVPVTHSVTSFSTPWSLADKNSKLLNMHTSTVKHVFSTVQTI